MTEAYTENGAAMLLGAGNECSTSVKKVWLVAVVLVVKVLGRKCGES
jgi:hypothetical protein